MRYVAKIHVLDVMDRIVVSGYVYDADVMSNGDGEALDFSYDVPGVGQDEPLAWMLNALYRALVDQKPQPGGTSPAGASMGAL